MEDKTHEHRKKCKRFDDPGHAHYLTFSCFRRQQFLKGERAKGWLVEAIDDAKRKTPFDLWAYVFMPEHVHLLLWPHEGVAISAILKEIKQPVAIRAVHYLKEHAPEFLVRMKDVRPNGRHTHRFWLRGGGYDRNLWTARDIHEKVHYIHENPVRRGLVESPGDWKWSSWNAWENNSTTPLNIDKESLAQAYPNL